MFDKKFNNFLTAPESKLDRFKSLKGTKKGPVGGKSPGAQRQKTVRDALRKRHADAERRRTVRKKPPTDSVIEKIEEEEQPNESEKL